MDKKNKIEIFLFYADSYIREFAIKWADFCTPQDKNLLHRQNSWIMHKNN